MRSSRFVFVLLLGASPALGVVTYTSGMGGTGWQAMHGEQLWGGGVATFGAPPTFEVHMSGAAAAGTQQGQAWIDSTTAFDYATGTLSLNAEARVESGHYDPGEWGLWMSSFSHTQLTFFTTEPVQIRVDGVGGVQNDGGAVVWSAITILRGPSQYEGWLFEGYPNNPTIVHELVLLQPGEWTIQVSTAVHASTQPRNGGNPPPAMAVATLDAEIQFIPSPWTLALGSLLLTRPRRR